MGFNKDLFIDELPLDLLCGICSDVLCEPIQVHCGEDHMFCEGCISLFFTGKEDIRCPTCSMPLNRNAFQSSKFVERQLGRLSIKCLYHNLGCTWTGSLSSDHIQKCTVSTRPCLNAENGCPEQLNEAMMLIHEDECDYCLMECESAMCSAVFLRKDQDQHSTTCRSFPCHYAKSGCAFIGTLSERQDHVKGYCGRLHLKISSLEQECQQLKQQLEFKKLLQPDIINQQSRSTTTSASTTSNNDVITSPPSSSSSAINNLHEMDFSSPFNDQMQGSNSLVTIHEDQDFNVTSLNSSPNIDNRINSNITSLTTSSTLPKRTPKGKRIRYSKNTKLAHGALRASKVSSSPRESEQEYSPHSSNDMLTSTPGTPQTPTTMMDNISSPVGTPISEDLTRKMDTLSTSSQHASSPLSFNTPDDVANFFYALDRSSSISLQQQHLISSSSAKCSTTDKNTSLTTKQHHSPLSSLPTHGVEQPAMASTGKPSQMFVLASSYLSSNFK
ncbi:uncharacterized protein BX664DRAFT_342381 [Halteromyces radiatus]|uniref:uncharacterized protein n=1 Tax=Halteromyces radiatus TaxID=101107 RepID=UPI00221F8392|nr:uncharacterized protein BX664DRAFT_342381 [Halteromyces radiatus]KAI8078644.1 hypothetical protein BX664DRAFT_342381 [Halteromyces radiatus]